jgi:Ca2+-transporting ATPase
MNRPDASSSPGVAAPAAAPPADPSVVDAAEVASSLGVDPASGLSSAEAAERLTRVGRNRLDPAAQVPLWRKLPSSPTR